MAEPLIEWRKCLDALLLEVSPDIVQNVRLAGENMAEAKCASLRKALSEIQVYAFVSNGVCKFDHKGTFAKIYKLAEQALQQKGNKSNG